MFFCPFCSTLLLVQSLPEGNALMCATCRYVHSVASTRGLVATNALGEPVLTIQHSFVAQNKKLMDAEDETPASVRTATASAAIVDEKSVVAASTREAPVSHPEEGTEELIMDGTAEGSQIMTIPCQNEDNPCDSNKAYYIQIQMRSADEPATVFFRCVKCGYQWRQD